MKPNTGTDEVKQRHQNGGRGNQLLWNLSHLVDCASLRMEAGFHGCRMLMSIINMPCSANMLKCHVCVNHLKRDDWFHPGVATLLR